MYAPMYISLIGISAAVLWGSGDFFAAKASRKNSAEATALWVSLFSVVAFFIIFLISPNDHTWSRTGVFYAIAAGMALEMGLYTLYKGLDIGPVSVVTPISSAYPVITALLVFVLFGDSVRAVDILGICITVTGIVVASVIVKISNVDKRISRGVMYAIAAFLLWGIAYALLSKAVSLLGWQKATLIDTSIGLVTLCFVIRLTTNNKLVDLLKSGGYKDRFILCTASTQILGGVIFTIGLEHARSSAVLTAISACYPAITIFLAIRYLHEKRLVTPLLGSIATVIGIVVLSVF